MLSATHLRLCMELAERIGAIKDAHLYDNNFITVEGKTGEGDKFSVTVTMNKEEKKDGN